MIQHGQEQGHMEATKWKKCHAGISLFAVNAGKCSDEMVIRRLFGPSYCHPHPRVCWAAFNFMEQPTNRVQAIQILYHWRFHYALGATVDHHPITGIQELRYHF